MPLRKRPAGQLTEIPLTRTFFGVVTGLSTSSDRAGVLSPDNIHAAMLYT